MSENTFPNGQTLTSSALTVAQANTIFQALLTDILGLTPEDANYSSAVRVAWQTEGAPAWTIGQDVISFQCVEEDSEYDKIRDRAYSALIGGTQLSVNYEYTRVWRITLTVRGPNSFDNTRLIRSALLLPWVHDTLAPNSLYLVPRLVSPTRYPEKFSGQWWEVVHFSFLVNEQVNESIIINTVASVEVIANNPTGVIFDRTYEV